MSTRKGKDQSAERAAPSKDHSPEKVKEAALMLFARRPDTLDDNISEGEWRFLVRQAFDLLDNLDKAYTSVSDERRKVSAQYQKTKKELPFGANGNVSYNAAAKFITDQEKRERAVERFETVYLGNARILGAVLGNETEQRQRARAQLAYWRKNGMPLNEVESWRARWNEKLYRRYHEATVGSAKKRRKPRSSLTRRDVAVIREANRDKRERKINVSEQQAKRLFHPRKGKKGQGDQNIL